MCTGRPARRRQDHGRALVAALGCAFRDTDADIVAVAGKPVSEIFVDDGRVP